LNTGHKTERRPPQNGHSTGLRSSGAHQGVHGLPSLLARRHDRLQPDRLPEREPVGL